MTGTGRLRWFGPLLASRISGRVFTNRTGPGILNVVTVTAATCQAHERAHLDEAPAWIGGAS